MPWCRDWPQWGMCPLGPPRCGRACPPRPDLAQLGNPWVLGTTLASTPSLNCQLRKWKKHLWEKQQNGGWAGRARSLARMAEGLSGYSALQHPG